MSTPLPFEKTFPCYAVTGANDWLSQSGNKVTDVKYLDDGKFIYYETDLIPEEPIESIIKLNINLGGLSISSPACQAQQALATFDFLSPDAPFATGWTWQQFQDFEIECADNTFLKMQGYTVRVPDILGWVIAEAGIRATIQYEVVYDKVQHQVLKLEKLLKYVLA